MTAASPPGRNAPPGAARLLEHCAVLDRLPDRASGTARARLESELGGDLAGLLCRALVARRGPRAGSLGSEPR